ncbi:MAG: hypothetical protein VB122_07420 [Erysipelotrichales bacterium]|nr:hypothetical protein [Erysipelotrichales bacterium]
MEKEKDIIKWLKTNNQKDYSYSDEQYKEGLRLFEINTNNKGVLRFLNTDKIKQKHKEKLHYKLTSLLGKSIESKNIVVVTPTINHSEVKPQITTIREVLKPDKLVALKAKSGQIFAKAAQQHRELTDKYFLRDSLTEDEQKEVEPIVLDIASSMNENISILQELDHYEKTGEILGNHPDLIAVDYSVLEDVVLEKKIKTVMSNIANYSKKLKTAKGEKKKAIAIKVQELKKKKQELLDERNRRKK